MKYKLNESGKKSAVVFENPDEVKFLSQEIGEAVPIAFSVFSYRKIAKYLSIDIEMLPVSKYQKSKSCLDAIINTLILNHQLTQILKRKLYWIILWLARNARL